MISSLDSVIIPSGFGVVILDFQRLQSLLFPYFQLPIFRNLSCLFFVIFDGNRFLSAWSSTQGVSGCRPKVKCSWMHDNLRRRRKNMLSLGMICMWNFGTSTYPVVPEGDWIWFPLEANLIVYILSNLVEKKAQNSIRFSFRYANNAACEPCSSNRWISSLARIEVANMPGFTKILFQPVAGCTRTRGWTVSISCLLTGRPAARAPSAWATALWTAFSPSR